MKRPPVLLLAYLAAMSCAAPAQGPIIPFNDAHIHYMGRVAMKDSAAQLAWPQTSVKVNFYGTGVKALLRDELGENYYNVIVDGKVTSKLQPGTSIGLYTLASGLPAGPHSLELFKRTEWTMGRTWLYQLTLDPKGKILASPGTKKRKIEFFGNSITCGYADEDFSGRDRGTSPYENGYISYAAITARHFDAELHSISRSGIGILISWYPMVMSDMYDRLDPSDAGSKWDFSKYTPDIVVINLFQNDSWLVDKPDHPEFKRIFGTTPPKEEQLVNAYRDLLKKIRAKYPRAHILCALGNMDATRTGSPWPGYIEKAAAGLKDKDIFTHFFPYKNRSGHPNPAEQQAMADDLISYIEKNKWW